MIIFSFRVDIELVSDKIGNVRYEVIVEVGLIIKELPKYKGR